MFIYHLLEIIILTSFFLRILYFLLHGLKLNRNSIEIFYFYSIWLINDLLAFCYFGNQFAFYFVHCTFPIAIFCSLVFRNKLFIQISLITVLVYFNYTFMNKYLIVITYLSALIFLLYKILTFLSKSRNERLKIPIYLSILVSIVFTQLIFLFGFGQLNWVNSVYIEYFLYTMRIIYFITLVLGHVYLRRFIIN